MTFYSRKQGSVTEIIDGLDKVWATIERRSPYYRVRLVGLPGSRLKKTATLSAAMEVATDWAIAAKAEAERTRDDILA